MLEVVRLGEVRRSEHCGVVQYEIMFEDADLKDTEDKFTSRDVNFKKLRAFNQ